MQSLSDNQQSSKSAFLAPRFAMNENVAHTMSSREIAEDLAAHLLAGTASKASAYEAAFMMVGNAALTLNKHLEHDVPNMSSGEARAALDLIESGREILKSARGVFDKYPFASAVIDAQLSVMFYAEATLIPFYLMCSRDALKNKKELASTYIVKHPITGLITVSYKQLTLKTKRIV